MKKSISFDLYRCAHCTGEFQFGNIRYTNDGKRIVCLDCYNRLTKSSQITKKEYKKTGKTEIASEIASDIAADSIKLICVNCRYKFSLKKATRAAIMCPYCGGNSLMRDDISADKLIDELSQNIENGKRQSVYRKY